MLIHIEIRQSGGLAEGGKAAQAGGMDIGLAGAGDDGGAFFPLAQAQKLGGQAAGAFAVGADREKAAGAGVVADRGKGHLAAQSLQAFLENAAVAREEDDGPRGFLLGKLLQNPLDLFPFGFGIGAADDAEVGVDMHGGQGFKAGEDAAHDLIKILVGRAAQEHPHGERIAAQGLGGAVGAIAHFGGGAADQLFGGRADAPGAAQGSVDRGDRNMQALGDVVDCDRHREPPFFFVFFTIPHGAPFCQANFRALLTSGRFFDTICVTDYAMKKEGRKWHS